jgi:hypothetical protein
VCGLLQQNYSFGAFRTSQAEMPQYVRLIWISAKSCNEAMHGGACALTPKSSRRLPADHLVSLFR